MRLLMKTDQKHATKMINNERIKLVKRTSKRSLINVNM